MTHEELQGQIVELAHMLGWKAAHWRPLRTAHGWRTACQYDAEGFPDLFLVHPSGHLAAFEVKVGSDKLSKEQAGWLLLLAKAGVDALEVRPEHFPLAVQRILDIRSRL